MIQILNKRSSTHQTWCEDNYFVKETDEFIIGAVLDGCSTGINSFFASTSVKYALEQSSKNTKFPNDEKLITEYIETLLCDVRSSLSNVSDTLGLTEMNFLSTIVLFIYIKGESRLYVKFIGDGVIYINGQEVVNDENNAPDYLGYHLVQRHASKWSEFYKWIESKRLEIYEDVNDFAICSDGIHSLVNLKNPHIKKEVAINFLIIDEQWKKLENGLNKKFNILTNRDEELKRSDELYWWDIKDDLTIIKFNSDAII